MHKEVMNSNGSNSSKMSEGASRMARALQYKQSKTQAAAVSEHSSVASEQNCGGPETSAEPAPKARADCLLVVSSILLPLGIIACDSLLKGYRGFLMCRPFKRANPLRKCAISARSKFKEGFQ